MYALYKALWITLVYENVLYKQTCCAFSPAKPQTETTVWKTTHRGLIEKPEPNLSIYLHRHHILANQINPTVEWIVRI